MLIVLRKLAGSFFFYYFLYGIHIKECIPLKIGALEGEHRLQDACQASIWLAMA